MNEEELEMVWKHLETPPLTRHWSGDCFACSSKNPIGLHLQFWPYEPNQKVYSKINLGINYSGFTHMAHGGIAAVLLDEIAAWTIAIKYMALAVTKTHTITYKRPTPIDQNILMEGWIVSEDSKNVVIGAKLYNSKGEVLVKSESSWVLVSPEVLSKISGEKAETINEMVEAIKEPILKYKQELDNKQS